MTAADTLCMLNKSIQAGKLHFRPAVSGWKGPLFRQAQQEEARTIEVDKKELAAVIREYSSSSVTSIPRVELFNDIGGCQTDSGGRENLHLCHEGTNSRGVR